MLITHVSIAGPDDDTNVDDLARLSKEFPFVEWAVLVAGKDREGTSRYPSLNWRFKFNELQRGNVKTSLHYCGDKVGLFLDRKIGPGSYERVQLNVRELSKENIEKVKNLAETAARNIDIIIPLKTGTEGIWKHFYKHHNVVFLYDGSGGHGKTPTSWRRPIAGHHTGYAGGLGPDNIKEVIKGLSFIVEDGFIWLDMESNVRTDNKLDMAKVQAVLEAAKPYAIK